MRRAVVAIKDTPHYRRDAFVAGLRRLGYAIVERNDRPAAGDVLLSWNLTAMDREKERYERAGGLVLVAENAYLAPPGAGPMYALARGGHNGSGAHPAPDGSARWDALGITLKPWRGAGLHILVCAQRGIGSRTIASPHGWHQTTAAAIRRVSNRPVVIRPHPGLSKSAKPLQADLQNAWAVVVWASAAGVRALAEGVPVFHTAPHWICAEAAPRLDLKSIEHPLTDDAARLRAMRSMAAAQWSVEEIATGEALKRTIEC